ncbi:MAG: calcineurin-like phosphoesterase family protein [marine benthic group bacterium]|nr:calcineurin-like phosphoesterase family protein [Gemmatimonadota bacterium]
MNRIGRREFVHLAALGGASTAMPGWLVSAVAETEREYLLRSASEFERRGSSATRTPVRVRGRVESSGRGVPRVCVSDGLSVVRTDSDGRFELTTAHGSSFVFITIPSGMRIPLNPAGTARFYEPISPDPGGEQSVRFELSPADRPDDRHAALLLADIQTQDEQEMRFFHEQTVPDVVKTVGELDGAPCFGLSCGDIMYDELWLYPEYERGVAATGIPFFQVLGNHDLDFEARSDEASANTFSRHFGPTYYSFERGAVHYVVLDDVFWHGAGYLGYIDARQLAWLEADLRHVEAGRPVIVALHIPVLGSGHLREGRDRPELGVSVANREALYRLLEPYDAHVLTGHTHENDHGFDGGVHEHVAGTVCGAWWSGPICWDGTPNGYAVYEVRGEEIRWRYKATGLPAETQIRAYGSGADPAAPTEVVANIWDLDPEWTVVWYEGGDRRGRMSRRIGEDPMSVELHEGPALPVRRTWVDPVRTRHLFYAPVEPGSRVTIEATDRFGRTYSAGV